MKAPVAPVDGVRESKENTLDIFATGLILNESPAATQERSAGKKATVKHKRTYSVCLNEGSRRTSRWCAGE